MLDTKMVALLVTLHMPEEKVSTDADLSTPTCLYYW
jgi:hypothetical protein